MGAHRHASPSAAEFFDRLFAAGPPHRFSCQQIRMSVKRTEECEHPRETAGRRSAHKLASPLDEGPDWRPCVCVGMGGAAERERVLRTCDKLVIPAVRFCLRSSPAVYDKAPVAQPTQPSFQSAESLAACDRGALVSVSAYGRRSVHIAFSYRRATYEEHGSESGKQVGMRAVTTTTGCGCSARRSRQVNARAWCSLRCTYQTRTAATPSRRWPPGES